MRSLLPRHYKLYTASKPYLCTLCAKTIEKGCTYATSGTVKAHPACYYERYAERIPAHEKVLFQEVTPCVALSLSLPQAESAGLKRAVQKPLRTKEDVRPLEDKVVLGELIQ